MSGKITLGDQLRELSEKFVSENDPELININRSYPAAAVKEYVDGRNAGKKWVAPLPERLIERAVHGCVEQTINVEIPYTVPCSNLPLFKQGFIWSVKQWAREHDINFTHSDPPNYGKAYIFKFMWGK